MSEHCAGCGDFGEKHHPNCEGLLVSAELEAHLKDREREVLRLRGLLTAAREEGERLTAETNEMFRACTAAAKSYKGRWAAAEEEVARITAQLATQAATITALRKVVEAAKDICEWDAFSAGAIQAHIRLRESLAALRAQKGT